MSDETLLSMDEGALRKLLEATLDLAERRQIRSAIRELRRQELERDEEALASKRFRTERQENKENWLRSRQLEEEQQRQKSLDVLSGKLEAIQDVEELTTLLRGASEYEERKLIRAAIRKLRAEEIEAAALAGKVFYNRKEKKETLESKEQEEDSADGGISEVQELAERELIRAQIRELRNEQHREAKPVDVPDVSSGTFLLLDPVPNQLSSRPSSSSFSEPESSAEGPEPSSHDDSSDTESQPTSKEESPPGTSGGEDREALRSPTGEATSDTMQEQSDMLSTEKDACLPEEPHPSLLSSENKSTEIVLQAPEKEANAACKVSDAPSHGIPDHCHNTAQTTPQPAASTDIHREQPFQRSGSVWERARKFSSEPPSKAGSSPAPQKGETASRGSRVLQQQQQFLHLQRGADLPGGVRGGSAGSALQDGTRQTGGCCAGTEQAAKPTSSQAKAGTVRPSAQDAASPKEAGGPKGRSYSNQWQGSKLTPARQSIENAKGRSAGSEESRAQPSTSSRNPLPSQAGNPSTDDAMKTLFTIEIKDGRHQPIQSHVVGTPGNQRAEITLGLRSAPIRITSTGNVGSASHASSNQKMDAKLLEQPQVAEMELSNGTEKEKVQSQENQQRGRLSAEELSKIEEEDVLDKMLDQTTDFEERRLIRAAMRELRQRKRDDGSKSSRMTTMESSFMKRSENGNTFVQTKSSFSSSSSKKVGSIFEREDESPSRAGSLAALERRQAEKKKELMKAQSLPKTSASQARKAMIEKLEKESGSPANPAVSRVAVQRSSSFGVPNANSIKQMLLDWCRAKTRGYEHVDIQNFSSSWSDGMAFCALVHNFFPEAFDYAQLSPQDRRRNFEMAFSAAEKHAECPQLLDVEDMVRMREPDWKCVYTYIQEFYRCLVQKGLVKTKKS
ncbi:smoothelin isoform X2 [Sphaerodactylus townsendi]|uniref:smoothelin isoform X2 n=1 Tax=Sphaerodactylus townsendi TaxID=933632 RepID=UPI0020270B3B|nr:smoothelin isoform X2 [Sphaerodactylus townsendi]